MKKTFVSVVVLVLLAGAGVSFGGEVVGQITDPCNMSVDGYVDILSAWVEKDGTKLIFAMEMRGAIPNASQLPDYNDTVTYIWLVDADNDPHTGQAPDVVGSEFNIRAIISQNPVFAGGHVDVTGSMTGPGVGGTGTVQVDDRQIRITIERSQIASVRRLHWRSDAWQFFGGQQLPGNNLLDSGLARVCRYGVLPEASSRYYRVGDNSIQAYLASDPETPVIDIVNQNSGGTPVFLSIERKYPDQDDFQIFGQATGHAGLGHLRNFSRLTTVNADPAAFGMSESQANFDGDFRLDGNEGETGPIPHGVFLMKFSHDYHVFASDVEEQATAWTFAQLVVDRVSPYGQMGVWVHQDLASNNESFNKYEETIDLADFGLELGVDYHIWLLLLDRAEVPQASAGAESFTDSTTSAVVDVGNLPGDIDNDWDVDLYDFVALADNWLERW